MKTDIAREEAGLNVRHTPDSKCKYANMKIASWKEIRTGFKISKKGVIAWMQQVTGRYSVNISPAK